jgi:hypothetical protein
MRSLAVLSMIAALSCTAVAQSPASRNSIYVEFLGNGVFYSCNYDHRFTESFGMRVGVGYLPYQEVNIATFPLMGYYLLGSGSHKLELGLGVSVILQGEEQGFSWMSAVDDQVRGNSVLGTATLGYRYQPADGGFVFRAGVTPLFGNFRRDKSTLYYVSDYENVFKLQLWGGISLGYAF